MARTILMDGAAGTALWDYAEKAGVRREQVWKYNIDHPEFVRRLHRKYIDAGCDMIQTNTFDCNRFTVRGSSGSSVGTIVTAAAEIALEETAGTGVTPYLSFGPVTALLEPCGEMTRQECREIYTEMIAPGVKAGISWVMLETFSDVEMVACAAEAAKELGAKVVCSMTFWRGTRTMMGQTPEDIVRRLEPLGVDGVGLNCSFGPMDAVPVIRQFRELTELPLYLKPNSGNGEESIPENFARILAPTLPWVSFIGGCCGTDENHIRRLKLLLDGQKG